MGAPYPLSMLGRTLMYMCVYSYIVAVSCMLEMWSETVGSLPRVHVQGIKQLVLSVVVVSTKIARSGDIGV